MKKLTKLLGMLFALMALAFVGCSQDGESEDERYYKVECGRMEKSYYETFMDSLGEETNFTFASFRSTRDDFKNNYTIDGSYEAQRVYSYSALKALLRRDLLAGLTPEGEIEGADFFGNNLTFIDVVSGTDWVTWVYIEK